MSTHGYESATNAEENVNAECKSQTKRGRGQKGKGDYDINKNDLPKIIKTPFYYAYNCLGVGSCQIFWWPTETKIKDVYVYDKLFETITPKLKGMFFYFLAKVV